MSGVVGSIWFYVEIAIVVILVVNILFVLVHVAEDFRASRRDRDGL